MHSPWFSQRAARRRVLALAIAGATLSGTAYGRPIADDIREPAQRYKLVTIPAGDLESPEIRRSLLQLKGTPCNSQAMGTLAPQLKKMGYRKESAEALISYEETCGNADGFLYAAFDDLLVIRDYPRAIAIADKLVSRHPANSQYHYSRAQAYTSAGQYESALPDYLEVIALAPNLARLASGVFLRTADAQARLGKACEAASTIRMWMSASPERVDNPQGKKLIADYEGRQPCQSAYAAGRDSFARKDSQVIRVSVDINGSRGMFIVDTGATFVALTKDFADRARIDYRDGKSLPMQTANGRRDMIFAQADRIKLGKISADQVPVVVDEQAEKSFGAGIDGLLGQSFLSRFDTHFGPSRWTISVPGAVKSGAQ